MSENILVTTLKYISIGIIWDIVYFPIWWYSKGLVRVYRYCINSAIFHLTRRVALGIWLRSMFKPMYGDYTKEGRIISVFMRLVVLIWKLLSTVLWFIVLFLLFIVWILLPIVIVYFILYQLYEVPLPFVSG